MAVCEWLITIKSRRFGGDFYSNLYDGFPDTVRNDRRLFANARRRGFHDERGQAGYRCLVAPAGAVDLKQ